MSDPVSKKSNHKELKSFLDKVSASSIANSEGESFEGSDLGKVPILPSLSGLWRCASFAYEWGSSRLVDCMARANHRFIGSLSEEEGQEVWDEILNELESEGLWVPSGVETYQGFTATLKDYDIERLERFDKVQTAFHIINNRELLSDPDRALDIGCDRPILVFFGPKFDDTGALSTKNYPTLDRVVGCGLFDVLYFETESDAHAEEILTQVYERTGRRVHTLMIDGHGSSTTLRMGEAGDSDENRIDTEDLQKDGAFSNLNEILDPEGQIILLGCCNGGAAGFLDEEEGFHPGDFLFRLMDPSSHEVRNEEAVTWAWWFNMADSFSQLAPHRPVYSSETATNLRSLRFDPITLKPQIGWTSEREYVGLSGIEEYCTLKKNVTKNPFQQGLSLCLKGNSAVHGDQQEQGDDPIDDLIRRAESLYGNQDPDFVEEYKEYVEMTIETLDPEKKLGYSAPLRSHIRTPEDYYKRGFLNLPERPENALAGSEFMQKVLGVDLEEFKKNPRQLGALSKIERENAIIEQIELGNIPDFLRRPKAVIIKGPGGEEVKTYVMPDYMAVGSNEDFVRVPLSPLMAQAFARKYGLNLPTKTIVEETYQQAGKRVVGPCYTGPEVFELNSPYLDSAGFYLRSSEDIQNQLQGVIPGTIVAGGKKELVVSPLVSVSGAGGRANESIDFYGLYDAEGVPTQRTPGHSREAGYKHTEYALGVRFVSPIVVVKDRAGRKRVITMDQALQDPEVAKIISRVERTETEPKKRCAATEGPFDPATAYRQNMPKGQKEPRGPASS